MIALLICSVDKRKKFILLADRKEDGWEVRCFQSDNLASDSEDEKRLNKSRRQAKQYKKEARTRRQNYWEKDKKLNFSKV